MSGTASSVQISVWIGAVARARTRRKACRSKIRRNLVPKPYVISTAYNLSVECSLMFVSAIRTTYSTMDTWIHRCHLLCLFDSLSEWSIYHTQSNASSDLLTYLRQVSACEMSILLLPRLIPVAVWLTICYFCCTVQGRHADHSRWSRSTD